MEEDKTTQQAEESVNRKAESVGDKDIEENKILALLSYLGVLVLVPLFGKKDSPFVQFHAKQGLVLLIGWVISWFPVFGWIIGIIVFVLSIIGILNVFNGEKKIFSIFFEG